MFLDVKFTPHFAYNRYLKVKVEMDQVNLTIGKLMRWHH